MAELSDASSHALELRAISIVDLSELFLHVMKIGRHVRFHTLRYRLIDIVHHTKVPLIDPGLYFYESIVMACFNDRVVHWKGFVEVDVGDMLGKSIFSESNYLLHSFEIIRLTTQLLKDFFSKIDSDVVEGVVVGVVRGVGRVIGSVVYDVHRGRRGR